MTLEQQLEIKSKLDSILHHQVSLIKRKNELINLVGNDLAKDLIYIAEENQHTDFDIEEIEAELKRLVS